MKNLSIFEPQIEKHHAYKKKTCIVRVFIKGVKGIKGTFFWLIPNFLSSAENLQNFR